MDVKKAILILEQLPADSGLDSEENWCNSEKTRIWRQDALEAIKLAIQALKKGELIGTLNIEGQVYKIVK